MKKEKDTKKAMKKKQPVNKRKRSAKYSEEPDSESSEDELPLSPRSFSARYVPLYLSPHSFTGDAPISESGVIRLQPFLIWMQTKGGSTKGRKKQM